jgi:hypothetical protein
MRPDPARDDATFPDLAAPFALLGVAGGWATGDAFNVPPLELKVRMVLALATPLTCALLGFLLTARARWKGAYSLPLLLVAAPLAGVANGVVVGLLLEPSSGAVPGAIFGAICCWPFLPPLCLVHFAAARAARTRPGTILSASLTRGRWLAVCASVAAAAPLGLLVSGSRHVAPSAVTATLALSGLVAAAALMALDVVALVRVRRMGRSVGELRDDVAPSALPSLDFGVGASELVEVAPVASPTPYRSMPRPVRRVHGSAVEAARALDAQVGLSLTALVVAAVGVSAALASVAAAAAPPG